MRGVFVHEEDDGLEWKGTGFDDEREAAVEEDQRVAG